MQTITVAEFESITGTSVLLDEGDDITKHKCFEEQHVLEVDNWGSEYRSAKNCGRYAVAAHYNPGMVAEARDRTSEALQHYQESYELRNTTAALDASERLAKIEAPE